MTDSLVATKLCIPILRQALVPRERVLGELDKGYRDGHLLTLVSAPAGYGKTTTTSMWVRGLGHPVAWVTLEKTDNDIRQFLSYVLTALQQVGLGLGDDAQEAVESNQPIDRQRVLALLANDLHELEQKIIVVLEDYHVIENPEIDEFIELLLDQGITTLHVVITTREDPGLALSRLRVRNQLTEIRAIDLSFSIEEVGEFLSTVMDVSLTRQDAETLKNRTEGWIAGLQLAGLSLKETSDRKKFIEEFRGTHRYVLDFLVEEVLHNLPGDVRDFLCRTSILEQLSPSLCEAVTGYAADRNYLQYLENKNLFLVALDQERTWYRYHALFRELLANQLQHDQPEIIPTLHERAADWYEENGFIQRAVEHAFQIPTLDKVLQLIEKHAIATLAQGDISSVLAWFEGLSESQIQSSPVLCISKAWALTLMQRRMRIEEVKLALQAAETALDRAGADEALRNLIAGHTLAIQAYILHAGVMAGERPEKMLETALQAQQLLPDNEASVRAANGLNIGHGYAALADVPNAERAYQQTYDDGMAGRNLYAAVYGQIYLFLLTVMKGHLQEALESCRSNIDRFNRLVAGRTFYPMGGLHVLKGTILLEQNRLEESDEALSLGMSLIRSTGDYIAHIKGYTSLARLRAAQGLRTDMLDCIKMLETVHPAGSRYAQSLRHRLVVNDPAAGGTGLQESRQWVAGEAVDFSARPDLDGIDNTNWLRLEDSLNTAHVMVRLASRDPHAYSFAEVTDYFARQERFAVAHGLTDWLVKIWIVQALIHEVEGNAPEAHRVLRAALRASLHHGYFRVMLEEADLLLPLLQSVKPTLEDADLSDFVDRLQGEMSGNSSQEPTAPAARPVLSERELDVLGCLSAGKSYKEIGQQLYLSLNTVQFHVKNIYGKLSVNRRVQAIEKARQMNLI